ncbi:MAG TPA: DUF4019 domain-containing protein [Thermoanaerobaculia bacterium]
MRDSRILILAAALCVLGAAKTPTPTPAPPDFSEKTAAQAAAEPWLKIVDAGQYGESWDAASEAFKKSLTQKQWITALTQVRAPLGALVSRKFRASQYFTDLPGAESGEYVVIEYDSQFASGSPMTERITPKKDPDGVWRVSGYFLVPVK